MAIESNNKKEILKLKLDGDWYLSEFEELLKLINNTYQIFYAINQLKNRFESQFESQFENLKALEEISPFWHEYIYVLRKSVKLDSKKIPLIPFLPYQAMNYQNISDSIEKGEWYIYPNDQIKINKIFMASPGEIHIEAGSAIREIRELIKDIKYRNEHEKKLGELEILEKQIDILEKIGVPQQELGKILTRLKQNGTSLEEMIVKGKIGLLTDEKA